MTLTAEQKARIEANKAKAMEIRRQRETSTSGPPNPPRPQVQTTNQNFQRAFNSSAPRFNSFRPPGRGSPWRPRNPNGWTRPGAPRFTNPHFQPRGNNFFNNGNANVAWQKITTNAVFLTIHDKENFKVEMKPFCREVNNVCQAHPRRIFLQASKTWIFPWSCYSEVKSSIAAIKNPPIRIDEPPSSVMEFYRRERSKQDPDPEAIFLLKEILWEKLYDYQKDGILKGIEFGGRILIADEMGLGKTVQALGLAFYYRSEWPLLIVCPASVKGSWEKACEKFLPGLCDVVVSKLYGVNQRSSRQVFIISYDSLAGKVKTLVDQKFHVVIYDESHMMKDNNARRTKAGIELSKSCSRVILCSGTPAVRGPVELFTQIRMINPKIFPNYNEYIYSYCDAKDMGGHLNVKGASRCDELQMILKEFVMVRRTKEDVEHALPPKTRHMMILDAKKVDSQMHELKEAQKRFEGGKPKDFKDNLMEFYRVTAIAKASAVTSYLENEYVTKDGVKDKLIIFGHHQVVLDTIGRMLENKGVRYMRIDGSTQNREDLVEQFQEKEGCKIALLSMLAAGTGITLTASSIVIFAELNWNPSNLTQAEDRAHRIGQTKPVQIYYLIAHKTADDYIMSSLRRKMKNLDAISLNTGTFKGATMSREETSNKITDYFESLIEDDNIKVININPRRSLLGAAADNPVGKEVVTIDENSGEERDDFDDDVVFIDEKKKKDLDIDESDVGEKKKEAKDDFEIDEWEEDDKAGKKDEILIDEWDEEEEKAGKEDDFLTDEWDEAPKSNLGLKRTLDEPNVVPSKKQR
ncbi:hypothetical protein FO519_005946 [Halicephalobus sp. NKZ332]|nr:hypothetical protein FO519_005946 [Halicephalobus sp. NKZ332]